jgi:hypothetical protein
MISPSCRKRSSAACDDGGSSTTSSRNSVPCSALRTRPVRSSAPENAPRRLPNSSLEERGRDRAAVDRQQRAAAPRQRVDRGGDDLLAGPRLAAHQDRHARPRDLGQHGELALERGRHGVEPGARGAVAVARGRRGAAQDQEAAADLQDVAVVELGALDALAVDPRAVLGAGVLDDPGLAVALDAGVDLGRPAIRELDPQPVAGALEAALGAAADVDAGDVEEVDPRRRHGEPLAIERRDQDPAGGPRLVPR